MAVARDEAARADKEESLHQRRKNSHPHLRHDVNLCFLNLCFTSVLCTMKWRPAAGPTGVLGRAGRQLGFSNNNDIQADRS